MKALGKKGFRIVRQGGSHMALASRDGTRRVIVPRHDEIKPGTVPSTIGQAGLAKDGFTELLD